MVPHIHNALDNIERTFLVEEFAWLIKAGVLGENKNAITRFKQALANVNNLYGSRPELGESKNTGLLGAFIYYQIQPEKLVDSFADWVIGNHIHTIEKSHFKDLVKVFDSILKSRARKIFVSMEFGKDNTENHYRTIERISEEINQDYNLKVKIKVERVDLNRDGTSKDINKAIREMLSDCGLLIGDLTYCNLNVYHEIGLIMGKAMAEGAGLGNFLLILDKTVPEKDKEVGFNLQGIEQVRFTQTEKFAEELKERLLKFFKLN